MVRPHDVGAVRTQTSAVPDGESRCVEHDLPHETPVRSGQVRTEIADDVDSGAHVGGWIWGSTRMRPGLFVSEPGREHSRIQARGIVVRRTCDGRRAHR